MFKNLGKSRKLGTHVINFVFKEQIDLISESNKLISFNISNSGIGENVLSVAGTVAFLFTTRGYQLPIYSVRFSQA